MLLSEASCPNANRCMTAAAVMDYEAKICGCDPVTHHWANPTCFSCFYMCENDWSLTMPVHGFLFASDTGITPAVKPMAPVGKILRTASFSSSTLSTRLLHLWAFFSHYGDSYISKYCTFLKEQSCSSLLALPHLLVQYISIIFKFLFYFSFIIYEKKPFINLFS